MWRLSSFAKIDWVYDDELLDAAAKKKPKGNTKPKKSRSGSVGCLPKGATHSVLIRSLLSCSTSIGRALKARLQGSEHPSLVCRRGGHARASRGRIVRQGQLNGARERNRRSTQTAARQGSCQRRRESHRKAEKVNWGIGRANG